LCNSSLSLLQQVYVLEDRRVIVRDIDFDIKKLRTGKVSRKSTAEVQNTCEATDIISESTG
jgi:hypothetical protein